MTSVLAVYPDSTPAFAAREAGGKGYNLYRLAKLGFPVPPWVVLGRGFFHRFSEVARLEPCLAGTLRACASSSMSAAEAASVLMERILQAPFPTEFDPALEKAMAFLGQGSVAVRSSASDEDGKRHSFAGQLSSFLYVEGTVSIKERIRQCWASAFSERALVYRLQNKIALEGIHVAVVLQRMIDPDTSGVMFTCDPVQQRTDRFVVSSVYGVGEGLVSGALDSDSFWLDAVSGRPVRSEVVPKSQAYRRSASGTARAEPVSPERQCVPSLTDGQLGELFDMGRKAMDSYGRPQDMEWAFSGGRVWVLQTRDVTTLKETHQGWINLWDNANIIESYGGITLPLSFTFALRNYRNVYVQLCEVLSVPYHVLKEMDDYLGNMLGIVHGRVYYNLYNWYKLLGILPGFKQNRQFMETMMGVSEALDPEIAERIRPHPSWDRPVGAWRKCKTGLRLLYHHFTIQRSVDRFLAEFQEAYLRYRNRDYRLMRDDDIVRAYLEMERNMLSRWKAPLLNDMLCMIHFGFLRKLTQRWLGGQGESIQNDLFAGEGNLESAEPTKQLLRLAAQAETLPPLKQLLMSAPPRDALEALNQSEFRQFYREVVGYIDRFGFRCMNEMKLEETDLYTDSSFFFVCLGNYLRAGTVGTAKMESRERELRGAAEQKVKSLLNGPRRAVYGWALKHARRAVRNRENTRFARTRIYGVARSMFQALGEELSARSVLEQARDIYFLTLEEVLGFYHGTLSCDDLQGLATVRKQCYTGYRDREPKARFTTRGSVYRGNAFLVGREDASTPDQPSTDAAADLVGLPCCPGVVEGTIKVVVNPEDDLRLDGEILAAPRTDPGWVPLYPSISGLLVERGSLLSHSAIVAREMGLPAIVSIVGLTRKLRTGMRVRMDGQAGTIKILPG